ncbi:MAG: DUF1269 domain-containing protein [Acidimicrobiia bacterium]|nr:DUF1269 domain-containing protein [Acidimicrobiia bacterium]
MSEQNLALYVAAYADADAAKQDFDALKAAEGADLDVVGAVVMSRDADGKVDVLEAGDENVAAGAWIGGGIGLVVGLFAPPLLAATAIGAGIGAVLGHFTKKHEEKELGADLDEYFPPNSSAVVVVVDNKYLDRVGAALTKADKNVSKAIDQDDYDKLSKAISDSQKDVDDAIDS